MNNDDIRRIESALATIPSDDRDVWIRMAMALKNEMGDAGFSIWERWSQSSSKYNERAAEYQWRYTRPHGARGSVTIASLFKEAQANGWRGDARVRPKSALEREEAVLAAHRAAAEQNLRAQNAAKTAHQMIGRAEFTTHPYLARKGFPDVHGLVLEENLLIPMRNWQTGDLQSVQIINAKGGKKFLSGGRAKGAVYALGNLRASETWLCEGYATALSIRAALKFLYRTRTSIIVCFSASNLANIGAQLHGAYVIADHDQWICQKCKYRWSTNVIDVRTCPKCQGKSVLKPAGLKAALQSGQKYWLPPEYGDANDFHLKYGVDALARELRWLLSS